MSILVIGICIGFVVGYVLHDALKMVLLPWLLGHGWR